MDSDHSGTIDLTEFKRACQKKLLAEPPLSSAISDGLSASENNCLALIGERMALTAGENLSPVAKDTCRPCFYLLTSGSLCLTAAGVKVAEVPATLEEGFVHQANIFPGFVSADQPFFYSASGNCELLAVDVEDFNQMVLHGHP